jgi:hypothetical protein
MYNAPTIKHNVSGHELATKLDDNTVHVAPERRLSFGARNFAAETVL